MLLMQMPIMGNQPTCRGPFMSGLLLCFIPSEVSGVDGHCTPQTSLGIRHSNSPPINGPLWVGQFPIKSIIHVSAFEEACFPHLFYIISFIL